MRDTDWISALKHTIPKVRSDKMATSQTTLRQNGRRKSLTAALFVLALGGASSVHATSGNQPPIVGPQVPPPQGTLIVYSERYVRWDEGDVAVVDRRPVELQTRE